MEAGLDAFGYPEPSFLRDGLKLSDGLRRVFLFIERFNGRLAFSFELLVQVSFEPVGDKHRQAAAVIDMGVRQDDGVKRLRVEGEVSIVLDRFGSLALEETAVEGDSLSVGFEQMERAGHFARSAVRGQGQHSADSSGVFG